MTQVCLHEVRCPVCRLCVRCHCTCWMGAQMRRRLWRDVRGLLISCAVGVALAGLLIFEVIALDETIPR